MKSEECRSMPSYRVGNLVARSDVSLVECQRLDAGTGQETVTITKVEPTGEPPEELCERNRFAFSVPGLASYRIEEGHRIEIETARSADDPDLRLYLYGTAWSALCHQRGLLPLHASAITIGAGTDEGLAAFVGDQRAGKSTIAAWMSHRLDYPLVTDDMLVLERSAKGSVLGSAVVQRHKLHDDSSKAIGIHSDVREGSYEEPVKRILPPGAAAPIKPRPLRHVLVLEKAAPGSPIRIEPLEGAAAVDALIHNTHRLFIVNQGGRQAEHLKFCCDIAGSCRVWRFLRPFDLSALPEVGHAVDIHLRALA